MTKWGGGRHASKYYMHALKLKPDSISAISGLVLTLVLYADDVDSCIQNLKHALTNRPDDIVLLTQLAIIRFFLYQDMKAARLLRRVLSINKYYAPALHIVGELLRFTGRSVKAIEFYERALQQDRY